MKRATVILACVLGQSAFKNVRVSRRALEATDLTRTIKSPRMPAVLALCGFLAAALTVLPSLARAQTLTEALDTTNVTWTTGGATPWFGQTAVTHDGLDAAQSGTNVLDGTNSWMKITVTGPGSVTFWWKVSSESGFDWLMFGIGANLQAQISGEVDWQERTYEVPSGSQNLLWLYVKDPAGADGQDKAWVDQVRYTTNIAPRITAQPQNITASEGSSVILQVTAIGPLPFSYQWALNDVPLAGATNSLLTFTSAQPYNSGRYTVQVTNAYGSIMSTSAVVRVTSPVPITLRGTNLQYAITDIFVTNGYAFLTGGGRALGVLELDDSNPATSPLVGQYTPPGWDRWAYSTSVQVAGRYAYVMVDGSDSGWKDSLVLDVSSPSNIVQVAQLPLRGWDVELAGDFAYLAAEDFVVYNVTNPAPPAAPVEVGRVNTWRAKHLCLQGNYAYVMTPAGVSDIDAKWLHIFDISNPAAPVPRGSYNLPSSGGLLYQAYGRAVVVQGRYAYIAANFYGLLIVDVADPNNPAWVGQYEQQGPTQCVWVEGRYAFFADEDWGAGNQGQGLAVVDVSDPANPIKVGGDTNTAYPSSVNVVDNRIYLGDKQMGLLVFEFARSAVTTPPQSRTAAIGETVTFSVSALGTPPLRYQWQAYGTNIPGATNATMSLTNVQTSQTGHYWVRVSNTNGSVFSPSATLIVQTPEPGFIPGSCTRTNGQFRCMFGSAPGLRFEIQASTNLSQTNWTVVAVLTNLTGTIPFTDTATNFDRRFYRAKEQ